MWSSDDLKWLKENYPTLQQKDGNSIEGRLSFQMLRVDGKYYINPSSDLVQRNEAKDYLNICDTYSIRIVWKENDTYFPTTYETGKKLASIANRLNKKLPDMHQYPDRAFCLAAPMELDREFIKSFKLSTYIENFLIPYLFAQSYYAKEETWLWGDLSHGVWGLLEWLGRKTNYDDADVILTHHNLLRYGKKEDMYRMIGTRCRNHKPCPCGSEKKTRNCHPEFQLAISRLRNAVSSDKIK